MTHDEKIVEAVARALCRRQIVSNLRWEKEPATPEFIQRCEDAGWQSGEWTDQARAAITAYQAEAWQPIETAPRDHFPRLTWSLNQGQSVAFLDVTWAWWSVPNGDGPMKHPPTHWRPLSPAPNPPASP